jgi:hypothetical protein
MTANYQEIASLAPPAASTPAIDFAIVLARTIADVDKDPAQLRNVVYQLARVKLQQEGRAKTSAGESSRDGTSHIGTRVRD